jgi:hypothetical protein
LLAIDVRQWKREGLLQPGTHFPWYWKSWNSRSRGISVNVDDGELALGYYPGGRITKFVQRTIVTLEQTPCHFGGHRVWFCCPRCRRRAAKLYYHRIRFVCRRCVGLNYRSQSFPAPFHGMRRFWHSKPVSDRISTGVAEDKLSI